MNKIAIAIVLLIILGAAGFFILKNPDQKLLTTPESLQQMDSKSEKPANNSQVIAGTVSQYKPFSQSEYEEAKAQGKTIFLNFYANWCPICRAEAPSVEAGFNKLNNPNVIGFRVNYKDDETDQDEKRLAEQLAITYQHSKVIIKGDDILYRQIAEQWDEEKLLKELSTR